MKEVLDKVKPSDEEITQVNQIVKEFVSKIKADYFIGGSYAKGTWISGIKDVDVFVRFPDNNNLSSKLKKLIGKAERIHGSRDYFKVNFKGIIFEIIPIMKINKAEEAANITDISPLHVKWVKKNITKKSQEAVLLFKKFLKSNGLYGAESYRRGFSGYVCEILALYYKSFDMLAKEISNWKIPIILDPEHHFKSKQDVKMSMNTSKQGPIILVDPVQRTRNAAAAISKESLYKIISLMSKYMKNPNKDFFEEKKVTKAELEKKYKQDVVWITLNPIPNKEDVMGAKLLKVFEFLIRESQDYGFKLKEKGWNWSPGKPAEMWLAADDIPKVFEINGPPISEEEHATAFKKKHKKVVQKGKRLVATETRKYKRIKELIKELLKKGYVEERVVK